MKLFPASGDAGLVQADLQRLKATLPSAKVNGGKLLFDVVAARRL